MQHLCNTCNICSIHVLLQHRQRVGVVRWLSRQQGVSLSIECLMLDSQFSHYGKQSTLSKRFATTEPELCLYMG